MQDLLFECSLILGTLQPHLYPFLSQHLWVNYLSSGLLGPPKGEFVSRLRGKKNPKIDLLCLQCKCTLAFARCPPLKSCSVHFKCCSNWAATTQDSLRQQQKFSCQQVSNSCSSMRYLFCSACCGAKASCLPLKLIVPVSSEQWSAS